MRVVHCKKESFTHYIGRPSQLGTPWSHRPSKVPGVVIVPTVEVAIAKFRQFATRNARIKSLILALPEDAVLGCWCKPGPCHGDVIVELHNRWKSKSVTGPADPP